MVSSTQFKIPNWRGEHWAGVQGQNWQVREQKLTSQRTSCSNGWARAQSMSRIRQTTGESCIRRRKVMTNKSFCQRCKQRPDKAVQWAGGYRKGKHCIQHVIHLSTGLHLTALHCVSALQSVWHEEVPAECEQGAATRTPQFVFGPELNCST